MPSDDDSDYDEYDDHGHGDGDPGGRHIGGNSGNGYGNSNGYGSSNGYGNGYGNGHGNGYAGGDAPLNGRPPQPGYPQGGANGSGYGPTGAYEYSEPFDYTGNGYGSGNGYGAGAAGTGQGPGNGHANGYVNGAGGGADPGGRTAAWPPAGVGGETMRLGTQVPRPPGPLAPPHGDAHAGPGAEDAEDAPEAATGRLEPLRGPGEGRADRRRAAKRIKRRRRLSATKEIPILIVVALLIALVLKTFLVQAFVIPSGSMEQTIKIGDRVLVDKLTPWFGSKPERGDVVVFKDPGGWLEGEKKPTGDDPIGVKQVKEFLTFIGLLPSDDEQDLIKRVVGVGGDRVKCCDKDGRVTVNGTPLDEPYLHPGNKPSEMDFDVTVPVGKVFVMGDHRANSADSRYHLRDPGKGTIPEDLVLGRAVVIAWPFDHWRRLEEPETYASVPDARGAADSASAIGDNRVTQLPIPAELPLVMGVVGLYRVSGRRQRGVRSDCGGLGGRRSVRFRRRRPGGPAS
ncbi:signal peptidase I [Streptomyces sp. NPDC054796]